MLNWADLPMETSPALENKLLVKHVATPVNQDIFYKDLKVYHKPLYALILMVCNFLFSSHMLAKRDMVRERCYMSTNGM